MLVQSEIASQGGNGETVAKSLASNLDLSVLGTSELVSCNLRVIEDLQRSHLANAVWYPRLVLIYIRLRDRQARSCSFPGFDWFWNHSALVRHRAIDASHGTAL